MSRYQVFATETDDAYEEQARIEAMVYNELPYAERELDEMTGEELTDEFSTHARDKEVLEAFDAQITLNKISDDDALEFAYRLARLSDKFRGEMIWQIAERRVS